MKQVKLKDGFEFEVDETMMDNMELVDALSDMVEAENPLALSRVVRLALGDKVKKDLYAHLKGDGNKVPSASVAEAVKAAFEACSAKN